MKRLFSRDIYVRSQSVCVSVRVCVCVHGECLCGK